MALASSSEIGDGITYATVADNIRLNACVSMSPPRSGACVPHGGGNQLPGYPGFIAAAQAIFGTSIEAVTVAQAVLVSAAIAYAAWRLWAVWPALAALGAAGLVAISPVTIAWPRLMFTESLSAAVALLVLVEALRLRDGRRGAVPVLVLLMAAAIFLRYDGVFLFVPVALLAAWGRPLRRSLMCLTAIALIALLPVAVWSVRNVSHGLSPLPIGFQTQHGWRAPEGYIAWVSTWLVSQFDYPRAMFPISAGRYRELDIPAVAYRGYDDRTAVQAALAKLVVFHGQEFPRDIDATFGAIAAARSEVATTPSRIWLVLRRAAHMWGTPFFSSGWPVQVDPKTRRAVQEGGAFAAIRASPLTAAVKGGGAVYRVGLLVAAICLLFVCLCRRQPEAAILSGAALAICAVRTGAFGVLALTETRYLVPAIVYLEVAVAFGLAAIWSFRPAPRTE